MPKDYSAPQESTTLIEPPQAPSFMSARLAVAILAGALELAIQLFRWQLVDRLTPLFEPLLELLVGGVFAVSLIWSMAGAIKARQERVSRWLPLGVSVAVLFVTLVVPFNSWYLDRDFDRNLDGRRQVVSLVTAGVLQPNVPSDKHQILLPEELRSLSKDGKIVVYQNERGTDVFFFTYVGVLDRFSGFLYRTGAADTPISVLNSHPRQTLRLREGWYFLAF